MEKNKERGNTMARVIMQCLSLISLIILSQIISSAASGILTDGIAYAQSQSSQETVTAEGLQELSPAQRDIIESGLAETGGVLTPEAVRLLKENPEFKDISKEEIIRGKKLLEKRESAKKEPATSGYQKEKEDPAVKGRKTVSLFDRYRSTGPYQDISTDLKPFGHRFFSKAAGERLIPRGDIPASSDYVIGPGDEIIITLWGRVNAQYSLVVNKDGVITVPDIGPLRVAGMRFDEMKHYVTEQAERIVGAKINITLGALKSIQVFVLGEVRRPGSYALSSFSTIINAVIAAGGPTEIGSLRSIQLKRNKKTVAVMDMYDFLLNGDKSHDKNLLSGDVIFVPTVGPLVGVAGNVKRPAVYELKDRYDLRSLFDMAGGVIPSAYTQQIQVERIQKNEMRMVIDINDKDLTASRDFILQDGDLVKVFSIVDRDVNVVFLKGNVKHPGKYEYKPGMRIKDIVKDTSDLLKDTYFEYALIKRLRPPELATELIPFNLGRLLFEGDDAGDIKLKPRDTVYIFSRWLFSDKPSITVEGEVRKKGSFELTDNYRVRDAILEAGGLTKNAALRKGEIFRTDESGRVRQIYFNVGLAMADDPVENLLLRDRDRVVIHSLWEQRFRQTVSIEGDVKNPGDYPLTEDMRISDLVFAAGNVLESAYLDEAEVSSFTMANGRRVIIDYKTVNLGLALKKDPAQDLLLKPYDRIFIKRIPGWREKRFVTISGEVRFPGTYIIKDGETLSSLIERAGGYTDRAYLRGAVFTREEVRKIQQQSIEEMIRRLETELFAGGSAAASAAASGEEIEAKKLSLEQKQKLLASLKKIKAPGRMSIKLAHLRLLKNSEYDIELKEGDSLFIPARSSAVNVLGAVMSRGSFVFSERLGYKDYIELAGGYTNYADEDNVYVLKADGTAMKLSGGFFNWNSSRSRWELSAFAGDAKKIEPGDSIVVPEKLERTAWLRQIKDLTQILYQIALTTGVVITVF